MRNRFNMLLIGENYSNYINLESYFDDFGIYISISRNIKQGWEVISQRNFDCILLDTSTMTHSLSDSISNLRQRFAKLLVVHAEPLDERKQIMAYEMGADYCLAKSSNYSLLLAFIKNKMSRKRIDVNNKKSQTVWSFAEWKLNESTCTLTNPHGKEVELTAVEFKLLLILIEQAGKVINRTQLLDLSKGYSNDCFERAIDVSISRLRKKIEKDSHNPQIIQTVRGLGYKFKASVKKHHT